MAKRLTDTTKWQDAWFMDLPSKYKLFWLFLLDACDHAGIWKVNFKVASFCIGEHLEPSEVKRFLVGRVNVISDEYWQLQKFIDFQYGGVKNDAVGKSVQKILKTHKMDFEIAPTKGLRSPYQGTKDKDKDKVMDKVKVKEHFILEENQTPEELFKELTSTNQTYFDDLHRLVRVIYQSAEEVDTVGTIRQFLILNKATGELDKPFNKVRSHLAHWLQKQTSDKIQTYGSNYKKYAGSKAQVL